MVPLVCLIALQSHGEPGELFVLGTNDHGQFGIGDEMDREGLARNTVLSSIVEIEAGYTHSFVFTADGALFGMGDNSSRQLGPGPTVDGSTLPFLIDPNVLDVAAGLQFSYFVLPEGVLVAIGKNDRGQLGRGDFVDAEFFTPIAEDVVSVEAGNDFGFFITSNGDLYGMGSNTLAGNPLTRVGKLGIADQNEASRPVFVAGDVVRVEAAVDHAVFLTDEGRLYGMGLGEPLGVSSNQFSPMLIATGVVEFAVGWDHTVYVRENGALIGLGANRQGQLGPDVPEDSLGFHILVEEGVDKVAAAKYVTVYRQRSPVAPGIFAFGNPSTSSIGLPWEVPVLSTFDHFDGKVDSFYFLTDLEDFDFPGWGPVSAVRNRVFDSGSLGRLHFRFPSQVDLPEIDGVDQAFRQAWSESLGSLLTTDGANLTSPEYGNLTRGEDLGWVHSEYFGWTYSGRDGNELDGWVSSERFGWMRFLGEETGDNLLWVAEWETWISVQEDGSFYSFDFGPLRPLSMESYASPHFETVFVGDYGGWFLSTRFGWVWVARETGGEWFYSEARGEWLAITSEGGIWSTAEGRFLP